jgi:hypothetical protein
MVGLSLVLDEKTEIPPGDSRRNFFLAMNSRKSSPPQDDVRFAPGDLGKMPRRPRQMTFLVARIQPFRTTVKEEGMSSNKP